MTSLVGAARIFQHRKNFTDANPIFTYHFTQITSKDARTTTFYHKQTLCLTGWIGSFVGNRLHFEVSLFLEDVTVRRDFSGQISKCGFLSVRRVVVPLPHGPGQRC